MSIKIQVFEVGAFLTNCYIIYDNNSRECMIIDPGAEANRIIEFISEAGLKLKCVINTHGHPDHIGANKEIKKMYPEVPLCIHRKDAPLLTEKQSALSMLFGSEYGSPPADKLLEEGDEIEIKGLNLKVLHTPGHTPGGISLLGDDFILTGDTLFYDSIGRSDLPGGDGKVLIISIKEKLLPLDRRLIVYPGHGAQTTIEREVTENPFLQ